MNGNIRTKRSNKLVEYNRSIENEAQELVDRIFRIQNQEKKNEEINTILKSFGYNSNHDMFSKRKQSFKKLKTPDGMRDVIKGLLRIRNKKKKLEELRPVLNENAVSLLGNKNNAIKHGGDKRKPAKRKPAKRKPVAKRKPTGKKKVRKIHRGPQGGKYYISKGRKVYI